MKYAYIGKKYQGDIFRKTILVNHSLKVWLEAIILTEQPYLAEGLTIENPDEETKILLKFCKFFSSVLRDENPDPIPSSEWSLEFEGKYHGLIGTYLNFIYNIYRKENKPD